MSGAQSEPRDASPALGCRENFFDHDTEGYEREDVQRALDDTDPEPGPGAQVLREEWVVDYFLRQHPDAELFCPYCWHELGDESALSDPEDYVPESEYVTDPCYQLDPDDDHPDAPAPGESVEMCDLDYGTRRQLWTESRYGDHRQHRNCENCGAVSWGGVLGDMPTASFLHAIREYLDSKNHLPPSAEKAVYEAARSRKQRGIADRDNRTKIAYRVGTGIVVEET